MSGIEATDPHKAAILHATAMRMLMSPKGKAMLLTRPHDLYEEAIVITLGDETIVFAMTRWTDEDGDDDGPERTVVRRIRPNQLDGCLKRLPGRDVPLNAEWMAVDTSDWCLDSRLEGKIRLQMDLLDRMTWSKAVGQPTRYAAKITG